MPKHRRSEKKPIEQYDHKEASRANNPPVGLVTPETDRDAGKKTYAYDPHIDPSLQFDSHRSQIENIIDDAIAAETIEDAKAALAELKKRQAPYLDWAGKAEHTSFDIPTVSLHVHERIDPRTIIEAVRKRNGNGQQMSLFEYTEENPPLREAIEFYKHPHNWSNRMVAGDSLLVMNSLLEKEGMAGKVQMIYIDPPYGIRYGSNFQPFVNRRDVKDGKDEDLTQEPEMIKAFRDTWELGIHSYLAYLRDRLLLARELLTESGSVFVQISDENVHHVQELMDEVFGVGNFVTLITFRKKTGPLGAELLPQISDYLIWYGKDISTLKFRKLYRNREVEGDSIWSLVELPDGTRRKMSPEEVGKHTLLPNGARVFRRRTLSPEGFNASATFDVEFEGKCYPPPKRTAGASWTTNEEGMKGLIKAKRVIPTRNTLDYVYFLDDFPYTELVNVWSETRGETDKHYVVQTDTSIVQRCLLMTTDPGDLVLDPTCGSGTTASVAEKWGRRWIACDTSRVAITLAKQRLMTALYDYYELAHPDEGVGSGFKYKTVPHITLKSIANNEPPATETLYDQPFMDRSRARVSGPFTVEAVPSPSVKPLSEIKETPASDESVVRSGETLRQAEWRDELFRTGIRGKGGQMVAFSRVEPLPGTRFLHADAETKDADPRRAVVSFGPEHAPMEQRQVALAITDAQRLVPKPEIIVFAAFQFDPEAAKDIDETNWPGVALLKAQMNADLLTEDLKKKRASNESFWLIGQPDVSVERITEGADVGKYRVEVLGFDYYNTKTGTIESGGTEKIAVWMLDTDYDERSIFPRQVFFPMAGAKDGWSRLAKNLKAEIDPELIEAYRGTASLPFDVGENRRVAVKIVDDRGIESLKIVEVE
ncbi:MAG: site-specific DNA-methyltransferase [Candidatus Methanogaster sp.]|uniref:Site-specific DNA-methyltransferase n=1 Tax=Candidatus Methanogaster sp. TaxID=3386292 RepID=A0AC61L1U3_9EURY|nr:MAG: site-specific DNA-methyltransferase [ANME-2 cluster archaeon]